MDRIRVVKPRLDTKSSSATNTLAYFGQSMTSKNVYGNRSHSSGQGAAPDQEADEEDVGERGGEEDDLVATVENVFFTSSLTKGQSKLRCLSVAIFWSA